MARGRPSIRFRSVLSDSSDPVGSKSGLSLLTRSMSSSPAALANPSTASGCSGTRTSPATRQRSREVAMITRSGPSSQRSRGSTTVAPSCSRLSSTRRVGPRPARTSASRSGVVWRMAATRASISVRVRARLASTHSWCAKSGAASRTSSRTRRVLPTPAGPVTVIMRSPACSSSRMCSSSLRRPTKRPVCLRSSRSARPSALSLRSSPLD